MFLPGLENSYPIKQGWILLVLHKEIYYFYSVLGCIIYHALFLSESDKPLDLCLDQFSSLLLGPLFIYVMVEKLLGSSILNMKRMY